MPNKSTLEPFDTNRGLNAEAGSYSSGGFFTPACDVLNSFPRFSDDFPRSPDGRAAVERGFRCVFHKELNCPCSVVATQFGGEAQRSVDACRDPRSEDVASVHDHALSGALLVPMLLKRRMWL
jgi:hypothetical protein